MEQGFMSPTAFIKAYGPHYRGKDIIRMEIVYPGLEAFPWEGPFETLLEVRDMEEREGLEWRKLDGEGRNDG